MLTNLVKDRKRDQLPAVEDIEGCSLLIVSGAFQNGIKATSWDLDTNLKAMWQLFYDLRARKDACIHVNLCETLHKGFVLHDRQKIKR